MSCDKAGIECKRAQLGSAAMLMGRGLGTTPSNFTLPLTLAAPGVLAAEKGLPALTDWPLHMQIAVTETRRITFFVFMTSQLSWTHPMLLSAKLPAKGIA